MRMFVLMITMDHEHHTSQLDLARSTPLFILVMGMMVLGGRM